MRIIEGDPKEIATYELALKDGERKSSDSILSLREMAELVEKGGMGLIHTP